ncbi:MAG TPA: LysR substrate-binding domain-containing protein [Solirubrobacterales bacterium]|jgi:DNA-binding transcriptional LysR family regulator
MGEDEPPVGLDLRRLRYFVVLAEELHFGNAALRLYIAQPVLSRNVQKLEQELGGQLLDRTNRSVRLTEAGRRLFEDGRSLLSAAEATRRHVQEAIKGQATLTVGFWISDFFADATARFHADWPAVTVDLVRLYWHNQTAALRDGKVDVAFLHGPFDDSGLRSFCVRKEPRVAVVSASSPLAEREAIEVAALADFPIIHHRGAEAAWDEFETVDPRPGGAHPTAGPSVENLEEKLAHVAAGDAVSFLPAFTAATVSHAGVAFVPVTDIPPIDISLAWRADEGSRYVESFVAAVQRTARRPRRQGPARSGSPT